MGNPVVIALDPATHCGCAIGAIGGVPRLTSVAMRDGSDDVHENIYGRAARWIGEKIAWHQPVVMAIEKPFFKPDNSNFATTQLLIGIYAVMTGVARQHNVTVWPVMAATWRKRTLGSAKFGGRNNAKKQMLQLCQHLGWSAPDDNAADAAGIWVWAIAKYAPYAAVPVEPLFRSAAQS